MGSRGMGSTQGQHRGTTGWTLNHRVKGFNPGFCPIFQHSRCHLSSHHPSCGVLCLGICQKKQTHKRKQSATKSRLR